MPLRLKLNSLLVIVLAAAFYWFFMFTKHDPHLAPVMPFGEDPFDAIGSFCLIVTVLLALVSAVRAFRPYASTPPSSSQKSYLIRSQAAVPLGVLITLGADGIAMVRQPAIWLGRPETVQLVTLLAGMGAFALFIFLAIYRSVEKGAPDTETSPWKQALAVVVASLVLLAVIPAWTLQNPWLHLGVILLADALIAAPLALSAAAVAPTVEPARYTRRQWLPWIVIVVLGIAVGGFALAGEFFGEGSGGVPPAKMLLIAALFLGAGTGLMLIGYGFLARPLGLFQKPGD